MAQLLEAFTDSDKGKDLKQIHTRPFPNLPDHILGQVKWLNNARLLSLEPKHRRTRTS